MSDFKNELEIHISEGLKRIDPYTRPTRGSGCGAEIGDIENKFFLCECKQKRTKVNIIMDYNKEWLDLTTQIPIRSRKTPICAYENKYGDRFVVMASEDFFDLAEQAYGDE